MNSANMYRLTDGDREFYAYTLVDVETHLENLRQNFADGHTGRVYRFMERVGAENCFIELVSSREYECLGILRALKQAVACGEHVDVPALRIDDAPEIVLGSLELATAYNRVEIALAIATFHAKFEIEHGWATIAEDNCDWNALSEGQKRLYWREIINACEFLRYELDLDECMEADDDNEIELYEIQDESDCETQYNGSDDE